jgi:hypothetical protein
VEIGHQMTTIAHSHRSADPRHREIDVRCSATLDRKVPLEGRCQLFAGHDGPHAVMFGRCGKRTIRTWTSRNPAAVTDVGGMQRPWMFGYPVPAWFETDASAERAD